MIALLLVLQLVLPLGLIIWLAVAPPHNLLGFSSQVLAAVVVLFAASLVGVWMFPPWWTPYVYGVFVLVAAYIGLRRRRPFAVMIPAGIGGWAYAVVFLALGLYAMYEAGTALKGRAMPLVEAVALSFPLEKGEYLVANGGNSLSINAHLKTLDPNVARFRRWRGNAYAIDIVRIDRFGLRARGLRPSDPGAYHIYGSRVVAPCNGKIVAAVDGLPDTRLPDIDKTHRAGNHVVLRCAGADIVLAHFRPGSLKVSVGSLVVTGQRIAEVGNSGASDEPHLHIHAQRPGSAEMPMSGEPLPMRFNGRFLVRNDRITIP